MANVKRLLGPALLLLGLIMTTGCSYNVGYKSTYLPEPAAQAKMDARVLVYTTAAQDAYVYSDHPKSFTASATTLSVPLGEITRQVAVRAFSGQFTTVDASNSLDRQAEYRVVVTPEVKKFEYGYYQLENLGFAITPKVEVELHVRATDGQGQPVLEKTYSSGLTKGESYVLSGSPSERTNAILHGALWALMWQAATEVRAALP